MGEGIPASKAIYTFVRMRMHCLGNILHGVRPQPAPFQNKGRGRGRAHSQAGLTQGRGMRGEGRAAQVASLRNWNPPSLTLSPLCNCPVCDCRWPDQEPGFRLFRGPESQPLPVPVDEPRPSGPGQQNLECMQILFS